MADLVLRPGAAAGQDTYLASTDGTDHYRSITGRVGFTGATVYRTLLGFDLSAIPADATVDAASLLLWVYAGASTVRPFQVHRIDAAGWNQHATWTTRDGSTPWTTAGGDYATPATQQLNAPGITDAGALLDLDLRTLAADAVANRGGALDLLVRMVDEAVTGTTWQVYLSDAALEIHRPVLTVAWTPAVAAADPDTVADVRTRAAATGQLVTPAAARADVTVAPLTVRRDVVVPIGSDGRVTAPASTGAELRVTPWA